MRSHLLAPLALLATPAFAEPPRVVTDIAPVQSLVAQVMGDLGAPALLLKGGETPHQMQLRPSQARELANAELIVWIGSGLSPWLAEAIESLAGGAESLALLEQPTTHRREMGAHEEHDHEEGHHHHGPDPHVWLSVENAARWVTLFADKLADLDPENAAIYRANAAQAQAGLSALQTELRATLAPAQGAEIITFHDSLGYFADENHLHIAATLRESDASSPSAARVAEMQATLAHTPIACAFTEPGFDPALLQNLLGDGVRVSELDPIGARINPGPQHYPNTLRAMARSIAECLQR